MLNSVNGGGWWQPTCLYEQPQPVGRHAGVVPQEVFADAEHLPVLTQLAGLLQGAEHQCPHHQVEQHCGQDGQERGAAHGGGGRRHGVRLRPGHSPPRAALESPSLNLNTRRVTPYKSLTKPVPPHYNSQSSTELEVELF